MEPYRYQPADYARRHPEGDKGSRMVECSEHRDGFARDRARVLHSAALRRLADKTQVVSPREGDTPRTRLTHSLEVAQIARGIGAGLGLNPDLCELAGLSHDIGHPPYGHNGEHALNEVAAGCGGFEGNAQTLRILSRLEPKVIVPGERTEFYGLNLTRAAYDAACKYPRTKTNPDGSTNTKYGCYDEDRELFSWIREGNPGGRASMEAQVMDFSDDIAYSVHDVEDGIISGRINLQILFDFVELAALADKGARVFGSDPEELIAAADHLRALDVVNKAMDFHGSFKDYVDLKTMTSHLVGRYVGAVIHATQTAEENQGLSLGRHQGRFVVPSQVLAEVTLLKAIAVLYVMDEPSHQRRQDRQAERIYDVYEYFNNGGPGALDPMYQLWWEQAESEQEQQRIIIDQIASMTESGLERLARHTAGLSGPFH